MDLPLLRQVALFQGLTQGQLLKVAASAEVRSHPAGAHVFREGAPGDEMYVVAEGQVRISKQVPGVGEEALAILERGQFFGEMALIEDGVRSADAIAHTACTLWAFPRARLDQLMFTDKDLAYVLLWALLRTLSERLRETNDKLKAFFAFSRFG
ncbi:MAG: cyclic nucleotide-binding domain-containing protein [Myxococcaceae bacterium]|nr:cyclic nucleotide-binding domain-containing protein [Myxococcaceae bacterium]MCI0670553.1 cyclic nucleotide-binding domain-containing protein [Myxococcaceae bacterium]